MTRQNLPPLAGLVAALLAATMLAAPARADNLAAALASAYETNPELQAQRAVVRQVDETVPQALSGYRPGIGASVGFTQNGDDFNDAGQVFTAGGQINQPLYTGGQTMAAVSAGEASVLAARAGLRAVENSVMVGVVTAYANVLALQRVVELTTNQVKVLSRELQASKDRFEVGDLTRTDVAQSEARLARSQSGLIVAQGTLTLAREAYLRVVGRLPADLEPLPPLPLLPGTPGQAVDIADRNNPALIAARFSEAAARYNVRRLEGQRLPTIAANAGLGYANYSGPTGGLPNGDYFTQSIGVSATVPLYQAGAVGSVIRQAQELRSQRLEEITATQRLVVESTTNSFSNVITARATIVSQQSGVKANTLALEGVKQENQVGSRTLLDVLNAEQELLLSEVDLVQARRDEYVASYQLLASMGLAEATVLQAPVTPYDSTANSKRVRAIWGDWNVNTNPPPLPLPQPVAASQSVSDFVPVAPAPR
ncbi:MAG: TolC family outer membrane protein [Polymorphobacter sp.]